MMRSGWRRRFLMVNALSFALVLLFALFASLGRDEVIDAAYAARPALREGDSSIDASASPQPPAPSLAAAPSAALDAGPPEPLDMALVQDSGAMTHREGTTPYRSPFAMPNAGPPARIKVGTLLNSVDEYDVKTGRFTADFFLSLTSPSPIPQLNLQFPNGKVQSKEVIADKPTFKLYRFVGDFKSPPDLRKYPFDSQELTIMIEDDARGIDQIRLTADKERTQLARGFRALGWRVNYVEARAISQSYPDRFENDDLYYGRYIFTVSLERYATSAAFKVFVPAFVIVLIAILGMWVPPHEMEVRSNAGSPMLAGAVLFHFALMQEVPATSYLTRADKLMLAVYISLALSIISTWWMFLVKEEKMIVVFRVARVLVPVLCVIVMALGCFA